MSEVAEVDSSVPVREGTYGDRVVQVEPGGIEWIPDEERHGRPLTLFTTWVSPNLEFATIYVGVLGIAVFGGAFWVVALGLILGTALGSISHAVLSSFGPKFGVPQMVQGRAAFGFFGNIAPALLMSVTSGIGWFAVNSVSATFALVVLLHLPFLAALLIVVLLQVLVAFFGHNLVQVFERYAFFPLVVVFAISAIVVLTRAHFGAGFNPRAPGAIGGPVGAFILTAAAAFGYACGWNPYASDYTRYLPRSTSRLWTGIWAGLGIFVSCAVLEIVGAALVTVPGTRWGASDNPTQQLADALPYALSVFTLLSITLGGIAANALNIYSGAMAFLTVGLQISARQRRAIVAIVFGAIGFVLAAWGSGSAATNYNDFLLLIAYWIAPWLGVMFTEFLLRRGDFGNEAIFYDRRHGGWQALTAFVVATALSIWLFANQTIYVGLVPTRAPQVGDLTFLVGFLLASGLYAALAWTTRRRA